MKKQQEQGLSPAEAKEKGGFSYVELNEKRSPRGEEAEILLKQISSAASPGPGGEAANSWASGLAAVALTPFRFDSLQMAKFHQFAPSASVFKGEVLEFQGQEAWIRWNR